MSSKISNERKAIYYTGLVLTVLGVILIIIALLPTTIYADVGPKPSLEIIVKGMDSENYWLDLLVTDESKYSWLDISDKEREKVKKLEEYEDEEGFHPALLVGTQVPLSGKLKGEKQKDNTYSHVFSYVGTPELFKIAILTEDNTLIISDIIHRKNFNSTVELDFTGETLQGDIILSAGKAREITPIGKISLGFITRLILTLIIEIGIALLFGFTLRKSGKILIGTNTITQITLNIVVLWINLIYGMLAALIIFVFIEILIMTFETWIYGKYLIEKSMKRRVVYGIIANLASLVIGFWINLKT